jgi:osmotically inducible protein OsmC
MKIEKVLYRAKVTASGGREGKAVSSDNVLDVKLTTPKELGGAGAIPTGFGIEVELQISLPGVDKNQAQGLIEKAHIVCPYSNAARGNIEVSLKLV